LHSKSNKPESFKFKEVGKLAVTKELEPLTKTT
jgi:hypothetical protein